MAGSPHGQAELISDALHGRRRNQGWRCYCPAHELDGNQHHPSLDVDVKDGTVLVVCRAGCGQAEVVAALQERGLWPKTERPIPAPVSIAQSSPKTPIRRYEYRAVTGETLIKERHDVIKHGHPDKYCVWYGPNGEKGLNGHKPGLYRESVLETAPMATPVLFVEGEKCVHAAEYIGCVAVSGAYGAESKPEKRWLEKFRGRPVWLLPDNDEPGWKHMKAVGTALKSIACDVRWVVLPDMPEKGDLADWVRAGHTRTELEELAGRAPLLSEADGPQPVIVNLKLVRREEVQYLWHPYVPLAKLTMSDGDPGTGKTWTVLAITTAVTLGARLPDDLREDWQPARVLILAGEDGLAETIVPRLEDMGANLSLVEAMVAIKLHEEERVLMLDGDGLEAIDRAVRRLRPALVVIDPLVAYLGGKIDTGKANEVRALLRPLSEMAARYRCGLLATRHLTKAPGGSAMYRGQGSIDFNAAARSGLITGPDPANPEHAIMAHYKSSLTKKGPSQAFCLSTGPRGGTVLFWEGQSALTADEILGDGGGQDARSALEEARDFLTQMLFESPMPAREITQMAKDCGIAERTLQRARTDLGVTWAKHAVPGRGKGGHEVVLTLPLKEEGVRPLNGSKFSAKSQNVAAFGGELRGQENGNGTPKNDGQEETETKFSAKEMFGGELPEDLLTDETESPEKEEME